MKSECLHFSGRSKRTGILAARAPLRIAEQFNNFFSFARQGLFPADHCVKVSGYQCKLENAQFRSPHQLFFL